MEPSSNYGIVDANRDMSPNLKYLTYEPKDVVGGFVKMKFTSPCCGRVEYMWVKVTSYNVETNEYEGVLDNDPVLIRDIQCGDGIAFTLDEVIDLDPPTIKN